MEIHTILGQSANDASFTLTLEERLRHIGIFGATGVGKTTLLLNLTAQDLARGDGLLLIDPHGDFAEQALSLVPPWRYNQVCYFNLTDYDYPIAFNLLDNVRPEQRAVAADAIVSAMRGIWIDMWGPRLEQILRHSLAALLEHPNTSLLLLPRFLTDHPFRLSLVGKVSSPVTRAFFLQQFDAWRDAFREEAIAPVLNKVDAFLFSPAIRNVIGQAHSTLHLEHAMRHGRIIIANLSRGLIGETASQLMGALLLARAQTAAMARASVPEEERRPFHLIVDEVQLFGTEVLGQLLSEARKYKLSLTMATQFMTGLDARTQAALMGNAGALVVFRVGHEDAQTLAPEFDRAHQSFNPYALRQLMRGEAMVRLAGRDGERLLLSGAPRAQGFPEVVKKQSCLHYGVKRKEIEARFARLFAYLT